MKKTSVDILLATYNGEAYLPQQLASLQDQMHSDFRVIIHDDGSTDGTLSILEKIIAQDKRFIMAQCRQTGLGAAGSFFALMKESSNPCCLCDQDDIWAPDHIMMLLRDMEQLESICNPHTPLLVMSDCAVIDAAGELLHPSLCLHQGWRTEPLPLNRLLVSNNATGCTMLMNGVLRELVANHAQPGSILMHDWFIAQTAACFGAAWFETLPLVSYRQHGSNTLGASQRNLLQRALHGLGDRQQIRDRLARTYTEARAFKACYQGMLTPEALQVIDGYLATESMTGLKRIRALRKDKYLMQNPIARMGQLWLG